MVIVFCDFSYLTAHTDSEGDSEEEKECIKSSGAAVKSEEEEEELLNFLQQVDNLHKGSEDDKKEGFRLLFEKDDKVLMGKFNVMLLLTYTLQHVRWCQYSFWVGIHILLFYIPSRHTNFEAWFNVCILACNKERSWAFFYGNDTYFCWVWNGLCEKVMWN